MSTGVWLTTHRRGGKRILTVLALGPALGGLLCAPRCHRLLIPVGGLSASLVVG